MSRTEQVTSKKSIARENAEIYNDLWVIAGFLGVETPALIISRTRKYNSVFVRSRYLIKLAVGRGYRRTSLVHEMKHPLFSSPSESRAEKARFGGDKTYDVLLVYSWG